MTILGALVLQLKAATLHPLRHAFQLTAAASCEYRIRQQERPVYGDIDRSLHAIPDMKTAFTATINLFIGPRVRSPSRRLF